MKKLPKYDALSIAKYLLSLDPENILIIKELKTKLLLELLQ